MILNCCDHIENFAWEEFDRAKGEVAESEYDQALIYQDVGKEEIIKEKEEQGLLFKLTSLMPRRRRRSSWTRPPRSWTG